MNWDAIGAVGEILGAAAVVATLVYLAQQIRRNAKSVEGSSIQAILELEITTYALRAQYANIYRRGCANILDLDDDASFDREWIRFYLKQPGFQVIWSEIKTAYPNEFCQHLDDVQKTVEGAAYG